MRKKLEVLLQAGERGDIDALYQYGMTAVHKYYSFVTNSKGYEYLKKAAMMGHFDAMVEWSLKHIQDPNNRPHAKEWLEIAARQGNDQAAFVLGKMILDDELPEESKEKGIKWLELSAENDSPIAALLLGEYYLEHPEIENRIEKSEDWFTRAARNGNVKAMRFLGKAYLTGEPFAKNISQGLMWYEKAIAQNDLQSMVDLSQFYIEGKRISRNLQRAEELLEKTVSKKQFEPAGAVMYQIAQYCFRGEIFPKDEQKGYKWLRLAAEQGDKAAKFEYGVLLYEGKKVKRDLKKAVNYLRDAAWYGEPEHQVKAEWKYALAYMEFYESENYYLHSAAESGLPEAMRDLGYYLMEGKWLEKNIVEGERWLQKAIEHGDEEAESLLAHYYLTGETVVKDKEKGISMLEEAVSRGNVAALNHYGWRLLHGNKVDTDTERGIRYLREAMEKNYDYAFANLGDYYCDGLLRARAPVEGERLLRQAVEMGNAFGMYCLGRHILQGRIKGSTEEAEQLLMRAIELGEDRAMVEMGSCYSSGFKCRKDKNMALYYYHLAAKYHNEEGKRQYEYLLKEDSFHWLKIAAEAGNVEAMYSLGVRYLHNIGFSKYDNWTKEARVWLEKAKDHGHQEAAKLLENWK